jgi:hypothetical protein
MCVSWGTMPLYGVFSLKASLLEKLKQIRKVKARGACENEKQRFHVN